MFLGNKKCRIYVVLWRFANAYIVHFERGCGLISTNSNNLVVEFKASQLEKDLITTDRKDLQKLKGKIQKYGESAYGNTE